MLQQVGLEGLIVVKQVVLTGINVQGPLPLRVGGICAQTSRSNGQQL